MWRGGLARRNEYAESVVAAVDWIECRGFAACLRDWVPAAEWRVAGMGGLWGDIAGGICVVVLRAREGASRPDGGAAAES